MNKSDTIAFIIGTVIIWVLVIFALFDRFFSGIEAYYISIIVGIGNTIFLYILIYHFPKKEKGGDTS